MEAFTLLKYWRGAGALGLPPTSDNPASRAATTTILTAVDNETTDDENDDFFDLEFTVPEDSENASPSQEQQEEDEEEEEEEEFKFALSPSSNDHDPNLSEANTQPQPQPQPQPQFTASLLKSATKFRVFMLGLKKPKPSEAELEAQKEKKLLTVKFKVEEVPIVSLFSSKANKTQKHTSASSEDPPSPSEDKQRFSKEVMQKYFKMVKPLYIRVSRRYAEKLNLPSAGKPPTPQSQPQPQPAVNNTNAAQKLPAGLSVVCKHLGKSRSASSAAVAAAPAAAPALSSKRRDDSLLQQQDGIQGAILHCKRSFNASRAECESSQLPRCVSQSQSQSQSHPSMNEQPFNIERCVSQSQSQSHPSMNEQPFNIEQ